jgi:hypothetical protein
MGKKVRILASILDSGEGIVTNVDNGHWEGSHHRPIEVTFPNGDYPIKNWWCQSELEFIEEQDNG